MAVQGSGASAATASALILKEQRFRAARPLKASDKFLLKRTVTVTSAAAADSYPVLTIPNDLGEVYLKGLWLTTTTDADPTTVYDTVSVGATSLALTEGAAANEAFVADADLAVLAGVDVAGRQVLLEADDASVTDDTAEVIIELEVARIIDLGTEAITGTAP